MLVRTRLGGLHPGLVQCRVWRYLVCGTDGSMHGRGFEGVRVLKWAESCAGDARRSMSGVVQIGPMRSKGDPVDEPSTRREGVRCMAGVVRGMWPSQCAELGRELPSA